MSPPSAIRLTLSAVVLPMVCILLDRPLLPALTLAWGYGLAKVLLLYLVAYPLLGLPSVWDSSVSREQFRALLAEARATVKLPTWLTVLAGVLEIGHWVAVGFALVYGGLP